MYNAELKPRWHTKHHGVGIMRRKGFSLIELLVVIGIIAILAAILFPMLTESRNQAYRTKCMSNMRQIATAMIAYADQNNGNTPFAWNQTNWGIWDVDTFRERIKPYLSKTKGVFLCPVKTKAPNANQKTGHYGINVYLTMNETTNTYVGFCNLTADIAIPSKTIFVSENFDGDWSAEPMANASTGGAGQFYPYHSSGTLLGGNFIWCDGHAAFMSVLTTQKLTPSGRYYYWTKQKI